MEPTVNAGVSRFRVSYIKIRYFAMRQEEGSKEGKKQGRKKDGTTSTPALEGPFLNQRMLVTPPFAKATPSKCYPNSPSSRAKLIMAPSLMIQIAEATNCEASDKDAEKY